MTYLYVQVTPESGHTSVVTGEVTSLYVHGLSLTCNEQTLYELFSPFGAVLNVKPVYDLNKVKISHPVQA